MKLLATNRALLAALGLAAALLQTGCPSDPCDDVECSDGEVCEEGECVPDTAGGKCAGVTCDANFGCNPESGECVNLCSVYKPQCAAPLACKSSTGKCEDLCAGVTCANETLGCNFANGQCEPKCKPTTCTSTQTCTPTTGACVNKCESDRKPTGKPECAADKKCKPTTGECVPLCDGVTCPYAQWCDDADGKCKGGKAPEGRPGAACTEDANCSVPNPAPGQEFTCITNFQDSIEFPGGYCAATCSQTTPCPGGSLCLQGLGCLDQCTKDAECRELPYRCQPVGGQQYVCLPGDQCTKTNPADCAPVGGDCATSEDCVTGASCIPEREENEQGIEEFSGFEGGYCIWRMRSTDQCPAGSTGVPISQQDPNFYICLKSCTLGEIGANGCGLGETCLQLQQGATTGVCWQEQCDVDTQCQETECTAQDAAEVCGSGQQCVNGKCRTNDKCDAQGKCQFGTCNTATNECFQFYCEASIGRCVPDCTLDASICGTGTTCNTTTKKCDRSCTQDRQCGGNAICAMNGATGTCQAKCTFNNEKDVCGAEQVCNAATGRCAMKCTDDASCGDAATYCQASTGRCLRKCNAATSPATCGDAQFCEESTGKCADKCTTANELQLCGADKFCQTSTGQCRADCRADASVCGTDSCVALETTPGNFIGVCGPECQSSADCGSGKDTAGYTVSCQTFGTSKRCAPIACTSENAATVCGAGASCSSGKCKAN